ncbi:MAG: hypothetical protein ACT4NJ_06225 [Nitrosopumilaceae archaeon]
MKIIIASASLIVTGMKNSATFFGFPNENKKSPSSWFDIIYYIFNVIALVDYNVSKLEL